MPPNGLGSRLLPQTPPEVATVLDELSREFLGITGAEFTRRWAAGAYENDHSIVIGRVAGCLPLAV